MHKNQLITSINKQTSQTIPTFNKLKVTCSIQMAGYGYTTDDLVFMWKKGDFVQVTKSLNLPRFTLQKYLTDYCTSRTNTGEYSCLRVDLLFKREFSYYLIQIFMPCAMFIFVFGLEQK